MISTVTFETSTFADVIRKAVKIAPSRGAAFDKAAGIVIEFDPAAPIPLAVVRVTNLDIFSIEWVNVTEWAGEAARWRLPSALLGEVMRSLPIGSGKTVTLTSEASGHGFLIHLQSGRTKARLFPIDISYYPEWGVFDPDEMFPAQDLGGRISQVEWAASSSDPRLSGVYLDGEVAVATDSFRLACVPLSIPDLPRPVVVPSGLLGQTLRETGEIQIRVTDNMVFIMPDEHTQMKTVIFDVDYPNVSRVMNYQFDSEIELSRDAFLERLQRVNAFSMGERGVAVQLYLGLEEIAFYMANEQIGTIGDVLEVPGYAGHERFMMRFTPKNLIDGLSKCPNDKITVRYKVGVAQSFFGIDGGSGYRAWIAPRAPETPTQAAAQ
jgi:DNA polymerase III sliding clamp (beta) subunit (PCNA family)